MNRCSSCKLESDNNDLYKNKYICKKCHNEQERLRYRNKILMIQELIEKDSNTLLKCNKCKNMKHHTEYDKSYKNCKECKHSIKYTYKPKSNNFIDKICISCNKLKLLNEYYKSSIYCKSCTNDKNSNYYQNNKENIIKNNIIYRKNREIHNIILDIDKRICKKCNIEQTIDNFKILRGNFYDTHCNICRKEREKASRINNIETSRKWVQENKVMIYLRNRLKKIVKNVKTINRNLFISIEYDYFIKWLKFACIKLNYDYDKHGSEWHLDHIIPCKKFDMENIDEQKYCFHWTNIIPLESKLNILKKDNIISEQIEISKLLLLEYINQEQLSDENLKYWNTIYADIIKKNEILDNFDKL